MANKNKAPKSAPAAPAATTSENNNQVAVLDMTQFMKNVQTTSAEGLDPNRRVDLLKMMHETFRTDPAAAEKYHMTPETVAKINEVTAIGQVAALACEITYAKNPFAVRMSLTQLEAMKEVGEAVGVHINPAMLPAPNEDGTVEVPANAISVSEETQSQAKKEQQIANSASQVVTDPTKITTEEELIAALNFIMVSRPNTYQKINEALNFYISYKKYTASKSENKDEELKKLNETDRISFLREMAKIVGACPLVLSGVGRYMFTVTSTSKSPIQAFCMFRNTTKNRETGVYAISDQECADFVRALVEWSTDLKREETLKKIATMKNDLELLKKDAKKNATGIKDVEEKIATMEKNIAHFDEVLSYVMAPSNDIPSSLLDNYTSHDKCAMQIFKAISDSYYDDVNVKEMNQAGIKSNIEQYAGVITNYFRDPSAKLDGYSLSNIQPLEPVAKSEETPADDDSKKEEA